MKVAKTTKPTLIRQFENLLWVNSPKDWILKSTYFNGILFVSMLIETSHRDNYQKIRRSFPLRLVTKRSADIHGLAIDCIDEMKTELK